MNDVTDILRDRAREPGGFERMAAVSALVHAALIVLVFVVPGAWFSSVEPTRRSVMTITLGGGAPGPASGGLTPAADRPVQEVRSEPPARPEPVRPPAKKAPEMTVPARDAPRRAAAAPVREAPDEARGKTPSRGEELRSGSSLANTGTRGQGFGLSSGGGGGAGVRLDVADFCCPEYVTHMAQKIQSNWDNTSEVPGLVSLKFTILRDGTITGIEVEKSSRFQILDLKAQRALITTKQLDPLPAGFPHPTLTVYFGFQYTR